MKEETKKGIIKRWTATRKLEVAVRYMKGEPLDDLSRELGLPASEIENWYQAVLQGAEVALKSRGGDPLQDELDQAKRQIGELSMQVELLKKSLKQFFNRGGGKHESRNLPRNRL